MKPAILYVCQKKRRSSDTINAGGNSLEENATCYLQILMSDCIEGFNRTLHMKNMDEWGYSFRLGSAAAWFHNDAEDTKNWLENHKIIDPYSKITWKLRG